MITGIIIGIVFLISGIIFYLPVIKDVAYIEKRYKIVAAFFIVFGITLIAAAWFFGENAFFTVLLWGVGIMCAAVGIFNVWRIHACTETINAVFLGTKNHKYSYVPRFSYTYEGKRYESYGANAYSRKQIEKTFAKGKKYEIFCNPNEPKMFATVKKAGVGNIMLVLMGIAIFAFGFIVLID